MKKVFAIMIAVVLVVGLLSSALTTMAAKPSQVIEMSNGFPSGFHFNLNIHGKDPATFTCPSESGGNSVFVPEYTADYPNDDFTIEMVSNKKSSVYNLTVLDACAMPTSLGGDATARIQLPYKIQPDELEPAINAGGYYVYARILGKPNNSKIEGDPSNIILTPSPVLCLGNDPGDDPDFPTYTDCEMALGLITNNGAYKATDVGLERFDTSTGGKGKSQAQNITDLFMWTGWVCDESLDLDGDGDVDLDDMALYNAANLTSYTTVDEWLTAVNLLDSSLARYYVDWWVFDIADLVIQSWGIENDGTKLVQIRFYPVATTEITEMAHIEVQNYTDPASDTSTSFTFSPTGFLGDNDFQMTNNQFCLSEGLDAGTYSVEELVPEGWDLTNIEIVDPSSDSTYDLGTGTANIDLDEGETVIVKFYNTEQLIL